MHAIGLKFLECVMSLEIEKTNNSVIIRPIGEFSQTIQNEFTAAYQNENPEVRFVLDMKDVTWIDSAALGMLIKLQVHTGGRLDTQIINSSPKLRELFNQVKFGEIFLII
jgi:HptB-dependent secretion and biofilm anti anti-sigma factor